MTKHTKTIDERIAFTLNADNEIPSHEISELITDVEAAAKAADEIPSKTHRDALDPTQIVDTKSVAAEVAAAALQRDRYQAALPRLEERRKQAEENEYEALWRAKYNEIEAERNALVQELRERYPALTAELIELVQRIPVLDQAILNLNAQAPDGVSERLQLTEQTARDINTRFGDNGYGGPLSLLTDLKLPRFIYDGRQQLDWPPPEPPLQVRSFSVPYNPLYSDRWREAQDALDKQRRAAANE